MTTVPLTKKQLSPKLWYLFILGGFFINLINQLIEQSLNANLAQAMDSESSVFLITALLLFSNSLFMIWILPLFFATLIQSQHPENQTIPLLQKINDFSKEWLRSLGVASLWFFVFIVPGIIKWIDFNLLPFVCFFDSEYQQGRVDALKRCQSLAKNFRFKLLGLLVLFGVLTPLLITSLFSDYESLESHPIAGSLLLLFESILQALSFWLLWRLYIKMESKRKTREIVASL